MGFVPQLRCGRKRLRIIACYEWLKKVIFSREDRVAKEPFPMGAIVSWTHDFCRSLPHHWKRASSGSEKLFQLVLLTSFDYVECISRLYLQFKTITFW